MDLALREGMSIRVNGSTKIIASLTLPSRIEQAAGQETLCNSANGIVVASVIFTDGTQAILNITP